LNELTPVIGTARYNMSFYYPQTIGAGTNASSNAAAFGGGVVRVQLGPQAAYNHQVNMHMGNLWKELEAENKRLQNENSALVDELKQAQERHAQQILQIAGMNSQIFELERELNSTRAALGRLREQSDSQAQTIKSLNDTIKETKDDNHILRAGLSALRSRVEDLLTARDAVAAERDEKSNEIKQLRRELQHSAQDVESLQKIRDEQQETIARLEDAVRVLKQSNQSRDRALAKSLTVKKQLLSLIHKVQELARGPGAILGNHKLQRAILTLLTDERVSAAANGFGLPQLPEASELVENQTLSAPEPLNADLAGGASSASEKEDTSTVDHGVGTSQDEDGDGEASRNAGTQSQAAPKVVITNPVVKRLTARARIESMAQHIKKLEDTIRMLKTENQTLLVRLRNAQGEQHKARFELKVTRELVGMIGAAKGQPTEASKDENETPSGTSLDERSLRLKEEVSVASLVSPRKSTPVKAVVIASPRARTVKESQTTPKAAPSSATAVDTEATMTQTETLPPTSKPVTERATVTKQKQGEILKQSNKKKLTDDAIRARVRVERVTRPATNPLPETSNEAADTLSQSPATPKREANSSPASQIPDGLPGDLNNLFAELGILDSIGGDKVHRDRRIHGHSAFSVPGLQISFSDRSYAADDEYDFDVAGYEYQ